MSMIEIKNLHKYFGDLEVLRGIDLTVDESEVVCLIGSSGSGKSTLLRCINFLEEKNEGEIYIDGQLVTAKDINQIRQKVGMVFQRFNLFPHMTVLQNVMEGPITVKKMDQKKARELAMALLEKVNLLDKADEYPAMLSGGQQQRVAIARALASSPQIILFDEPTSALDPEMIGEVLYVMKALAHSGITMIVVTHEMQFAREIADRIVFIDGGQILETAPPAQFFSQPSHPRAQRFLQKVLNPLHQEHL